MRPSTRGLFALCLALAIAACGSDKGPAPAVEAKPKSLTIVAYDSFSFKADAFAEFTQNTGIAVKIVKAGDAGTMLSKAPYNPVWLLQIFQKRWH